MTSVDWGSLLKGRIMNNYDLGAVRGYGGFCFVMEAKDRNNGHMRALKILPPGAPVQSSLEFNREGALLTRLKPASGVVDVYNSGSFDMPVTAPGGVQIPLTFHYHELELAGGCLEELVINRDQLLWPERLLLWRCVVRGVHQMHVNKIVHRDLKSSNCLLFVQGGDTDCKVADLGRSRDLRLVGKHTILDYEVGLGDMRFAPPEFLYLQGSDTPDSHRQADLYGLGSLLFEITTGQAMTSFALGHGPQVVRRALTARGQYQSYDLSGLRANFEPAFDLFERCLPPAIRLRGSTLLRRLCDPVPSARGRIRPFNKSSSKEKGLEWLLIQADILSRALHTDKQQIRSRRRRGA